MCSLKKVSKIQSIQSENDIVQLNLSGLSSPLLEKVFLESNQQADKMCGIIHFGLSKLSVHIPVWIQFIVTFYTYFSTDLQSEAFQLSLPMW